MRCYRYTYSDHDHHVHHALSFSVSFFAVPPRSLHHRLDGRLRSPRSTASTEYSLARADSISLVRSVSPSTQCAPRHTASAPTATRVPHAAARLDQASTEPFRVRAPRPRRRRPRARGARARVDSRAGGLPPGTAPENVSTALGLSEPVAVRSRMRKPRFGETRKFSRIGFLPGAGGYLWVPYIRAHATPHNDDQEDRSPLATRLYW